MSRLDDYQQKNLDEQIERDRVDEAVEEVIDEVLFEYINNVEGVAHVEEGALRAALRFAFTAWEK